MYMCQRGGRERNIDFCTLGLSCDPKNCSGIRTQRSRRGREEGRIDRNLTLVRINTQQGSDCCPLTCMSLLGFVVFAHGAGILLPGHMTGMS